VSGERAHTTESSVASACLTAAAGSCGAAKEVVAYVIDYDLGIKGYFQQFPGLNRGPIGDGEMSSEGRRVAECITFGDVELN
jgi:hypothetical protein